MSTLCVWQLELTSDKHKCCFFLEIAMCSTTQPMNTVETKGTLHMVCSTSSWLPSAGTYAVVSKDLLECNLAWPRHSKIIHSRAVEEILECLKGGVGLQQK